jgi:hypothetical protein
VAALCLALPSSSCSICSDPERKSRSPAIERIRLQHSNLTSKNGSNVCGVKKGAAQFSNTIRLLRCSFIDGGPVVLGRYQPLMAPEVSACEWRKGSQVRGLQHDSEPRAVSPDGRFFSRCVETPVCRLNWQGMIEAPIRIRVVSNNSCLMWRESVALECAPLANIDKFVVHLELGLESWLAGTRTDGVLPLSPLL